MKLEAAVRWNGMQLQSTQGLSLSVIENGQSIDADIWCPDTATGTAVALVLDNSGTMSGVDFDSLKAGALSVVRMLGIGDEAAIYHFSNGGERIIDFTGDIPSLETAIGSLAIGANTPIYHTMTLALEDLAAHPAARKFMLVFTDGVDNASGERPEDVADAILAQDVTLFMIGYGSNMLSQGVMEDVARRSGGFYQRVYAPAQIAALLREIGGEVLTRNCVITWETNCTDSLRALHVTAQYSGEVAEADTLFASPWRPDQLHLRVSGPARLTPGQRGIIYVDLDPRVPRELPLSFEFLLLADHEYLEPTALTPVTLGTITQNTAVQLVRLSPGVYRFRAEYVYPGMDTGHLVGISMRALAATQSHAVPIRIKDVTITSGCPNTVTHDGFVMEICQCEETLIAHLDTLVIMGNRQQREFHLCWESFGGLPSQLRGVVQYDTTVLTFAELLPGDPGWRYELEEMRPGELHVAGSLLQPSSVRCMLLRFTAIADKEVQRSRLLVPKFTAYAMCCEDADTLAARVLVDGICSPLLRRNETLSFFPHPAADVLHLTGRLEGMGESSTGILRVYTLDGVLATEQSVILSADGGIRADIDLSALRPGRYTAVLRIGTRHFVRPFVRL
ncbi:MAG: VWA domain-containing protein [Bacteroidetes bacterium]|nr:VWA domain-containing protein [Bacteroidota bacterium]